ncbi:MAG: hypothetical protein PHT83_04510 [Bacilli bacterium]|nr:hypothetical protein [Bacilli bacterium]
MYIFVTIIYNNELMHKLMKKIYEEGYRGSILPTMGLRSALLCSTDDEPAPIFGSLSKLIESEPTQHPALFIILKNADKVETLKQLVKDYLKELKGKGFMFAFPVSFVEGIEI